MGLFSFLGSIFGGNSAKEASTKAMQAQTDAYNRAIDIGNQQFQTTRTDYMPYTTAGASAMNELAAYLGLGGQGIVAGDQVPTGGTPVHIGGLGPGQTVRQKIEELKQSPIYQSRYNAGEEALLQTAAATGGLRGGNTQRGLADFGSDVLASVYSDLLARLAGVAQFGVGATGSVAGFGAQNTTNAANLTGQIGNAQAANYLTRGGITANQWASAGGFLDDAASAGFGGGGGFNLGNALKSIF